MTERAVRRFQTAQNILSDGIVGRDTHRQLLPWYTGSLLYKIQKGDTFSALAERYTLVPVCPEQLGGLQTPRPPSERLGGRVRTQSGADVTAQFSRGAAQALYLAQRFGCVKALMKERSPSCGSGSIYDGSFRGRLTDGFGVAAELLLANGIAVLGESRIEELLK